jgi:hypothetical protein
LLRPNSFKKKLRDKERIMRKSLIRFKMMLCLKRKRLKATILRM